MVRRLILTVDLDRDANIPLEGTAAAGSADRGSGTAPRFSSAEKGLHLMLKVLDSVGVPATFFVEGRTAEEIDCSCISGHCIGLHGYDHEDLTGRSTGVRPDVQGILEKGYAAVSDAVSPPVCFRAPYMSCDDSVLDAVSSLGIRHDSSLYSDGIVQPYRLPCGMMEHPVPKGKDASGRTMAAYLWPMHEGARGPEDYIRFADTMEEGDLIIADHTWHMVERRGSLLDSDGIRSQSLDFEAVLSGILDMGFVPAVMVRPREERHHHFFMRYGHHKPMADLHDRWVAERKNEHYYKLAKKLNYRSRASFKLIQIDNRFGIFKQGDAVVDLGACPGGWLQVAKERTWPEGKVIGVDLRYIRPLEGVETIIGDITEDSTMLELLRRFGGKADVVLSDMAPNIAGHYSMDHARSIDLCMYAVNVCDRILKKEGKLVMKVFMGDMFDSLTKELEQRFQSVKVHSPDASRDTSSEVYVICQGFYARNMVDLRPPETPEKKKEFKAKGGVF